IRQQGRSIRRIFRQYLHALASDPIRAGMIGRREPQQIRVEMLRCVGQRGVKRHMRKTCDRRSLDFLPCRKRWKNQHQVQAAEICDGEARFHSMVLVRSTEPSSKLASLVVRVHNINFISFVGTKPRDSYSGLPYWLAWSHTILKP